MVHFYSIASEVEEPVPTWLAKEYSDTWDGKNGIPDLQGQTNPNVPAMYVLLGYFGLYGLLENQCEQCNEGLNTYALHQPSSSNKSVIHVTIHYLYTGTPLGAAAPMRPTRTFPSQSFTCSGPSSSSSTLVRSAVR